jgi:hypothetical protein
VERSIDVDDLLVFAELERLKYRYLRCLDQKDWDGIAECFAVDATASYSGGAHSFDGRDAIVGFLRDAMGSEEVLSSHRVSHPELARTGTDDHGRETATGTWAMEDTVLMLTYDLTLRGAGFYEDRYVREEAGWLLQHTGYRRTFEEIQPRAPVEGLKLTGSWWGTGGRSLLG